MAKKIISNREWKVLKFELFENKPKTDKPYPPDVVKRRELLLLAQCLLADYQFTKSRKYKSFFGKLYRKTMETYFAW